MALQPCRECGQTVSTQAPSCPHCGVSEPAATQDASRSPAGARLLFGLLALVFVAGAAIAISGSLVDRDALSATDTAGGPVAEVASEADDVEVTPEKRAAAREVFANLDGLATLSDHGSSLDVRFDDFIFNADDQTRYRLMSSVADADAVLQGKARTIYFRRPDGKEIGRADRFRGVQLAG